MSSHDNGAGWRSNRVQVAGAALLAVLLALVMNIALVAHLSTDIPGPPKDPGYTDALAVAYTISWGGHAAFHQPLRYYDANFLYPLKRTLAFADAHFGYAIPTGWIGDSPRSALIRYNLLHLFAYALAFFGAWLLARQLGVGPIAAVVAGVAYAYAPWRAAHNFHLLVLSSGGIPLALALLVRGYRGKDWRFVLAGWLVATWQLMLGFTLGLMFAYLLAGLSLIGLVWWLRQGRPQPGRRVAAASVLGVIVFVGWGAFQAIPFLQVASDHPEAKRSPMMVEFFSPSPTGFLTAPEENLFWGETTAQRRGQLNWPSEQSLFPGALALALGMMGLLSPVLSVRRRVLLLAIAMAAMFLSFGLRGPGAWFFQWVLDYVPGWRGIRTPGRIATLTTLAIAILAASGAQMLLNGFPRERRVQGAIGFVFAAVMLFEGAFHLEHSRPPARPSALQGLAEPQMHLPSEPFPDMHYVFWTVGAFERIANGHGSFIPREQWALRDAVAGFPDAKSLAALRGIGVRTVVFHRYFAAGTRWENVAERPIDGLGIQKRDAGDVVIFKLESNAAD